MKTKKQILGELLHRTSELLKINSQRYKYLQELLLLVLQGKKIKFHEGKYM
jgi:hypothetical protein